MKQIKILSTISLSLTVDKVYEVINEDSWTDEDPEGNKYTVKSVKVIDDDGDEYAIVNFDEAEYVYV